MATETFELVTDNKPFGSQPQAITKLTEGLKAGKQFQTLLGVTGSGKTFTTANVIKQINKPTLVIAHNKTLAAQLYEEYKLLFPNNRVEYFVSYYDYYQPESYLPAKDQYIEKDASVNPKIEQLRLSATASLLSRNDVIVVASVSCIYGLGNPENFYNFRTHISTNMQMSRKGFIRQLVESQYERNDTELQPGRFRVKGETVDFIPAYYNNVIRVEFWDDEIDKITELDKITLEKIDDLQNFMVFPAKHFMIAESELDPVLADIEDELEEVLPGMDMLEAHRLKQRTMYDLDMIKETGYCKGIENYSRHFDRRSAGARPFCLLDYFPEGSILIIDESHQTIPQLHGMYKGDRARKKNLIDFGFRLPSAYDNRPLQFEEFQDIMTQKFQTIFVSATPAEYEYEKSDLVVEQIIRPTGLVDPKVEIKPIKNQVIDVTQEIQHTIKKGHRILVTTLTKRLAEELTEYLAEQGIKTRYLHSEIHTLERTEIIRELRLGEFDVLVGINLLREGLDIPEVGFVGILDADKEGFLRNDKSLIQTIGRAARNAESKVILYADTITESIKRAVGETKRRRELQIAFNKQNNITPKTIIKPIKEKEVEVTDIKHIPKADVPNTIIELQKKMEDAADRLEFETAIQLRNQIAELKKRIET